MKDNRVIRPEVMNERDVKVMSEAVDSFYDKHYGKGLDERLKAEREADANRIVVDGKVYDKRFYKGEM